MKSKAAILPPLPPELTVAELVRSSHQDSLNAGWWRETDPWDAYVVPTKLMLIVSEIAEAMEGHRRDLRDDKLPHRKMIEVELADAMLRIADLAGWLGLDLEGAIREKQAYNRQRSDHKISVRSNKHGKMY